MVETQKTLTGDTAKQEKKEFVFGDEYPPQEKAFASENPEAMNTEMLIGKRVLIINYVDRIGIFKDREGNFKEFSIILAELDAKKITFSAGGVIRNQITKIKQEGKLPMWAEIARVLSKKSGQRYYTLA